MSRPWPSRPAPGIRGGRRTAFVSRDPQAIWRGMFAAVAALTGGQVQGPGAWEALRLAREACMGAAFPIDGEDAKAASNALLELTRTWPRTGEDRRGWHADSVKALARHCEVLMEQRAAALSRRMGGERD
jgi:hypothetical protein